MLGELVMGRSGLAIGSAGYLMLACNIAVRYSFQRRQFGLDKNEPEIRLIDYQTQQQKLIPLLASAYAMYFSGQYAVDRYASEI